MHSQRDQLPSGILMDPGNRPTSAEKSIYRKLFGFYEYMYNNGLSSTGLQ